MQKMCEICGDEAVYTLSPDLDIQGLGTCEEHKEVMRQAYLMLMTMGEEEYRAFLKQFERSYQKKKKI